MPSIGSLQFNTDDGLDSGVALRLVAHPEEVIDEHHLGGHLLASPSTPYAICRFAGATSQVEAWTQGTELLQQALDLHSMLGGSDLQVKDVRDEHICWWTEGDKRVASLTGTATFSARVGNVQLIARDAQGNVIPPAEVTPRHHIGFRFYRLAQVSDDLYDAFRNMYLAFESLLSTRHQRGKEHEVQWLERAMRSALPDLDLATLCPRETSDPVAYIVGLIYTNARLPLFHAKDGKTYFAPGGAEADRAVVLHALSLLTSIVVRMADVWHSARRRSGWFNLKLITDGFRGLAAGCQVIFSDEPTDNARLKDEARGESAVRRGISVPGVVRDLFHGATRTHIAASFAVDDLAGRNHLHAVYVAKDGSPLIGVTPDTVFDVGGFSRLDVYIFVRGRNANQPKSQFAR
jgi:hypothetical protein